jgi:hypothetical protein
MRTRTINLETWLWIRLRDDGWDYDTLYISRSPDTGSITHSLAEVIADQLKGLELVEDNISLPTHRAFVHITVDVPGEASEP